MTEIEKPNILDVLSHASVGLAIVDISGVFTYANEAFTKLHRRAPDRYVNYDVMSDPAEEVRGFQAIHREFQAGTRERFCSDVEVPETNGLSRWFSVEATLVRNPAGEPSSVIVINHDITQRKLAERRASLMAHRLEAIETSDAIGLHYFRAPKSEALKGQKEGVDANEALLAMSGLSKNDETTFDDLTTVEWRDQDRLMFEKLYETGRPISYLKEIVNKKTGRVMPVSVTATLFKDDPDYDGVSLIYDLSDLFNARDEAEEFRHKADLALGAASIGLWDCNPATGEFKSDARCRKILGLPESTEITIDHLISVIAPEDRLKVQEAISSTLKADQVSRTAEFRYQSATGERIVSVTGRSFRGRTCGELRLVGTLIDITDLKAHESRLLESEERFRTLAETIPQIVFTADQLGHVNYINKKFYDFTGQRPADVVSREQIRAAIHPSDLEPVRAKWKTSVAGGRAFEFEYRMKAASGDFRWVIVRASPLLDRTGQTTRWFGSCTDIDGHRRANDELFRERERAQHANEMKSTFLANMSHEIRTPLGAILGFTELLGNGSLNQTERNDYLGIIARNSKSLSRIVDDVLDLSKVEAGLLTLEKIAFCPRTLLKDVITLFSERARRKGLMLDLRIADDVPASIVSDPTRLRQVINNLLSNALKFTENGGVIVELCRSDLMLKMTVRDTGPGIPPDRATTLFQPFVQAHSSMARKHGGTGLGLHLSRKLAEALGGALRFVELTNRSGSCFEVLIPLIEATMAEADPWRNQIGALQETRIRDLDGLRILVVDDAPDNRKLLERILVRTGARVDFAENGRSAIDKTKSDRFDLILMDLQMPDLDGFEATRIMRENHVETPVVALTAHAVDEIRERCEKAGFNGFLTKPVDSKALMKTVRDFAANRTGPQPNESHHLI